MYATLAGDYPGDPLPGLSPSFREARQRRASGLLGADEYEPIAAAFVAEIVREQATAGLTIVADGHVRWPGGLTGLADGLLDGSIGPRDVVAAWSSIPTSSGYVAKQVLPGPFSVAAARAESSSTRRALEDRSTEVLVDTVSALVDAGCELVQVDEPAATEIGDDAAMWRRFHATSARLAGRLPAVHRSLSLPDGAIDPAGHGAIADLPYESYLIDVLAGADSWRLVARIPDDRGIICGAVDVHTDRARDDPEMLVWAATLAAEAGDRGAAGVAIAANGDLAPLGRFTAKRKIERLGIATRLVQFGPLTKVARALQPDPAACPIPSLRQLMSAHAAAGLTLREDVWPDEVGRESAGQG